MPARGFIDLGTPARVVLGTVCIPMSFGTVCSPRNAPAIVQALRAGVPPANGRNEFRNSTGAPRGMRCVALWFRKSIGTQINLKVAPRWCFHNGLENRGSIDSNVGDGRRRIAGGVQPSLRSIRAENSPKTQPFGPVFIEFLSTEKSGYSGGRFQG